eukprot:m.129639 g.129639  ORF g.129639 m.129639 type:complete len:94 (+) comp16410_c0_seq6:52-333(+)
MRVKVEFSGGAELLAGNVRQHQVDFPGGNMKALLAWVRDHVITERHELFMQGDSVRPGILVLVNDTDWELLDELAYQVQENDSIVFISTLHGG